MYNRVTFLSPFSGFVSGDFRDVCLPHDMAEGASVMLLQPIVADRGSHIVRVLRLLLLQQMERGGVRERDVVVVCVAVEADAIAHIGHLFPGERSHSCLTRLVGDGGGGGV